MVCLTGVCYQSLGQFRSAVSQFSRALLLDQTSCCWYQREVALFIWSRLDKSLKTFNLDSEVDPRIKDGWCKRASWRHILPSASSNSSFPPNERYVPLTQPKQVSDFDENSPNPPDQHTNSTPLPGEKPQLLPSQSPTLFLPRPPSSKQEAIEKLLHFTAPYGEWLQLRCPGFLPNIRQVTAAHNALPLLLSTRTFFTSFFSTFCVTILFTYLPCPALLLFYPNFFLLNLHQPDPDPVPVPAPPPHQHAMFGLASLQMAQSLRTHISSVHLGGPGLQVPDASSSYLAPSASKGITAYKNSSGRSGCSSSGSGGRAGAGAGSSASSGAPSTGKRQNDTEHTFAWRDFFDIVVKWRQVRHR